MSSTENNHEDWKEMRARVDSIANAVFLIGGGALSLSISVILNTKSKELITSKIACIATYAWYFLLSSIILSLGLKIFFVAQSHFRQSNPDFSNKLQKKLNASGWIIGLASFLLFIAGLFLMVYAASEIVKQ